MATGRTVRDAVGAVASVNQIRFIWEALNYQWILVRLDADATCC
jgi:hypothetical protein